MFNDEQRERYSRTMLLEQVGEKGQERLCAGSVLIIGAGGLGSAAALYLAASGVGRIGIADADVVDLSNLQRQVIHTHADIFSSKAVSAADKMRAIDPNLDVDVHQVHASADNVLELIEPYDFIIDGTDSVASKFLVNDACVLAGKPFSHAGVVRFFGQTMTYVPNAGPCYRCLFETPPPSDTVPTCCQVGVLGPAVGVMGCLQAAEALKYLTGVGELLCGRLLTFDALEMKFRCIDIPRAPGCAACGEHPTLHAPVDYA